MTHAHISKAKEIALQNRLKKNGLIKSDLTERFISGASKGGQKANKACSGVYLKHEPSGIEIKVYTSRYRAVNRYKAREGLCRFYEERILGLKTDSLKKAEKVRKQKKRRARRHIEKKT